MTEPACAWCGAPADWQVEVEPGRVIHRRGRVDTVQAPRTAPACDQCRHIVTRMSPARRAAKAEAWARWLARRQTRLF